MTKNTQTIDQLASRTEEIVRAYYSKEKKFDCRAIIAEVKKDRFIEDITSAILSERKITPKKIDDMIARFVRDSFAAIMAISVFG